MTLSGLDNEHEHCQQRDDEAGRDEHQLLLGIHSLPPARSLSSRRTLAALALSSTVLSTVNWP
jgi:hypothetical protein